MNDRNFKVLKLIFMLICIILIFIDYKIGLGIMLGIIFSDINYRFIEYRYRNLNVYSFKQVIGILLSISILIVPVALSFIFPNIFNWIGVAIGLLLSKISIIILSLKK